MTFIFKNLLHGYCSFSEVIALFQFCTGGVSGLLPKAMLKKQADRTKNETFAQ